LTPDPADVRLVVVAILSVVVVLVLLARSPVVAPPPVSPSLIYCIPLSMELLRLIVDVVSSCVPREVEEE
jgi:hypothetical protein